jgi:hypothetical protein
MSDERQRPITDRERRKLIWSSVGLVALGIVAGSFFVITFHEFLTKCDGVPESQCHTPHGGYPALLAVVPPVSLWYGLVALPRRARVLRDNGRRLVLRPRFARAREREWVFGVWPRAKTVTKAWLVADVDEVDTIAIPVSVANARRCVPDIAALVRGRPRRGAHVVVDFPSEIIWPIGRVERVPADASPDPDVENEPRWARLRGWQLAWRVPVIIFCLFLAVDLFTTDVDVGDTGCGSLAHALSNDAVEGCGGEAGMHVAGLVVSVLLVAGLTLPIARDWRNRSS